MPFDPLDLYGVKHAFARTNELRTLVRETAVPAFLLRARRALLAVYDLFIDRSHWPRLIRQGHDSALDPFRDAARPARPRKHQSQASTAHSS